MNKSEDTEDSQKTETLRFNDHLRELNEQLQVLLVNQQFCDITLISSDREYKIAAHKVILASASKYFLAMFGGSLCESEAREVKLEQIDGRSLKAIINFIYKGEVELTIDTVEGVLVGAHVLELSSLEKLCCGYMKKYIYVSNCLGIAALAKHHGYIELYKAAMLCACKNFAALRDQDEFHSQTFDQLCELISRDELRMPSEGDVFHGILAWINYEKDGRRQFFDKLLSFVRLPLLSPRFINEFIVKECESSEALEILDEGLAWHANIDHDPIFSSEKCKVRNFKDVIVAISHQEGNKYLNVGLYYSGLNEWIYTKWPSPPNIKYDKFKILGKKLLMTGKVSGKDWLYFLNLETFEFSGLESPPLVGWSSIMVVNGTLYATSYRGFYKLEEPMKEWILIEYSDTSVLRSMRLFATCKDLIYFPYVQVTGYFATYNPAKDILKKTKIQRYMYNDDVDALNIVQHLDSYYLVDITRNTRSPSFRYRADVYDLNTAAHVFTNHIPCLPDFKSQAHCESIIMHSATDVFLYNVFENRLHTLPLFNFKDNENIVLAHNSF